MEDKRIIEIGGVKMEVDLRDARVIENYRVGDHIKVLKKEYSDYKSYIGTIIGFDNFKDHPTIVIAFMKCDYSSAGIEFVYYNCETKDTEIAALNDWDIPITKSDMLTKFNKDITAKEEEVNTLKNKKLMFEKLFGKYFNDVVKED